MIQYTITKVVAETLLPRSFKLLYSIGILFSALDPNHYAFWTITLIEKSGMRGVVLVIRYECNSYLNVFNFDHWIEMWLHCFWGGARGILECMWIQNGPCFGIFIEIYLNLFNFLPTQNKTALCLYCASHGMYALCTYSEVQWNLWHFSKNLNIKQNK